MRKRCSQRLLDHQEAVRKMTIFRRTVLVCLSSRNEPAFSDTKHDINSNRQYFMPYAVAIWLLLPHSFLYQT